MSYIYQLNQYLNALPPAGRLFYALLSYLVDLIILLFIVEALEGGPQWETIVILSLTIAYTLCLDKIWRWIDGGVE